jgi:hypothetical protein
MFEMMGAGDDHGNGETEQTEYGFPALPVLFHITAGLEILVRDKHVAHNLEICQDTLADRFHLVLFDNENEIIAPYMADKTYPPWPVR